MIRKQEPREPYVDPLPQDITADENGDPEIGPSIIDQLAAARRPNGETTSDDRLSR